MILSETGEYAVVGDFVMEPDDLSLGVSPAYDEDTSNGENYIRPWDPAKIRITTKNFSLREIVEQIDSNEIDLAPDFQREFVWKRKQRTRLIESILLGIPLPAFYFNQDDEGKYQVVDGVQRLSTIHSFMSNSHLLTSNDLEYLVYLDGKTFDSLDPSVGRRFRSAQIVVHVIEPQTPDDVKYDIFNRVNTLGSPLSGQEIRHAMSKARSRKFLKRLTDLASFSKATNHNFWKRDPDNIGELIPDTNRMMNRELALRFCAFNYYQTEFYKTLPSMDGYFVAFLKWVDARVSDQDGATDEELERLLNLFDNAMINCHAILGEEAFRRQFNPPKKRAPINRAIFEAQALALSKYHLSQLLPYKEKIAVSMAALFEDDEYTRAVTVSTGAAYRIEYRLFRTSEAVRLALN